MKLCLKYYWFVFFGHGVLTYLQLPLPRWWGAAGILWCGYDSVPKDQKKCNVCLKAPQRLQDGGSHWTKVNQSIIYLLITHQAMKQHEHQDETSWTDRHQVHLGLPLYNTHTHTHTNPNTVVKWVQMSKIKEIKWAYNKMTRPYTGEIKNL